MRNILLAFVAASVIAATASAAAPAAGQFDDLLKMYDQYGIQMISKVMIWWTITKWGSEVVCSMFSTVLIPIAGPALSITESDVNAAITDTAATCNEGFKLLYDQIWYVSAADRTPRFAFGEFASYDYTP